MSPSGWTEEERAVSDSVEVKALAVLKNFKMWSAESKGGLRFLLTGIAPDGLMAEEFLRDKIRSCDSDGIFGRGGVFFGCGFGSWWGGADFVADEWDGVSGVCDGAD